MVHGCKGAEQKPTSWHKTTPKASNVVLVPSFTRKLQTSSSFAPFEPGTRACCLARAFGAPRRRASDVQRLTLGAKEAGADAGAEAPYQATRLPTDDSRPARDRLEDVSETRVKPKANHEMVESNMVGLK